MFAFGSEVSEETLTEQRAVEQRVEGTEQAAVLGGGPETGFFRPRQHLFIHGLIERALRAVEFGRAEERETPA